MRKYIPRILVITLLFGMLLTVNVFAEDGTVTGSDVNLRSGPGVEYSVLDCLPKGATVTVVDRSNSSWYNVIYNGQNGYISSRYVQVEEYITEITDDTQTGYIIIDDPDSPFPNEIPVSVTPSPSPSAQPAEQTGDDAQTGSEEPAEQAQPQQTQPESTQVPGVREGVVNAMYVRFRSGPGSSYSILGEYNTGTKITVLYTEDGWSAIVVNGKPGYMFTQYITMGDKIAQTPTETAAEPVVTPVEETSTDPTPEQTQPQEQPVEITGSTCYITGDYVCFREGPSTTNRIICTYNKGKQITVTGEENGWKACTIDGTAGYIYAQYVSATDPTAPAQNVQPVGQTAQPAEQTQPAATTSKAGYIKGNSVRFRSGASTSSQILAEYNYGKKLTITGVYGDWTACEIDGISGYVFSSYVAEGSPATEVTPVSSGGNLGQQIAEYALTYVGYNYTWGGTSPDTGFDCSGFTTYVFGHFGIKLNRVACDQASNGNPVGSGEELQPGDLLCFYSGNDYIGHVGIYIGNNQFVHASTSTTGVIISELNGYYVTRTYVARRFS